VSFKERSTTFFIYFLLFTHILACVRYWRGVTSELGDSIGIDVMQIRTKPTNHLMRLEPQMGFDTISLFGVGMISTKDDLAKFYNHLHEPLVKAGIDGVKVDVQSGVSAAGSGVGGGPHVAKIYTEAMENSVSKHFASVENGAVDTINCMCHSTENLYRYKVTAVARASDDFYPLRPESHSVHLVNVAYNSLFLGEICLPDWDMFHSKHKSAELHAAARAIGGSPVYVSDVPGEHNISLLKKLVLPDGSVLRAQLPGRPTRDCLFTDVGKDGKSALKIWNQNKGGVGVVGAFNVQGVAWNYNTNENEEINPFPEPVLASVKPYDVEPLRASNGPFAVWKYKSSTMEVLEDGETTIEYPLESRDWDLFTIAPLQNNGDVEWAPIGLGDMLNSGGALLYQSSLEEATTITNTTGDGYWRQTTTAIITTRGPGRFVAYCKPIPSNIIIDDGNESVPSELSFSYNEESGLLEFVLPNEKDEGRAHQVSVAWDR
jgi:raffinose synthase